METTFAAEPLHEDQTYDQLLSIKQVAHYLNVPVNTLYWWRRQGTGPRAMRFGKSLRYRRSDIEEFLDDHTDPRTP